MPPSSDVRALAARLCDSDAYTTFLDVLPLQRLTQLLLHMPRPTLDAIIHLHDQPHLTLGAKDVLSDLLRSYFARAAQERALGQKPLRLGQHNKIVRLSLGQTAQLILLRDRGEAWQVHCRALEQSRGDIEVHKETPQTRGSEERLSITAVLPGVVRLRAQLEATLSGHPVAPWPSSRKPAVVRPKPKALRREFCLTVVVEDAGS